MKLISFIAWLIVIFIMLVGVMVIEYTLIIVPIHTLPNQTLEIVAYILCGIVDIFVVFMCVFETYMETFYYVTHGGEVKRKG